MRVISRRVGKQTKLLTGKKGDGWAIDGHLQDLKKQRNVALFPQKSVTVQDNSRLVVT